MTFRKGCGNNFSAAFCVRFFKKNVSRETLDQLIKFHWLICVLRLFVNLGCDVIKFEINLIFLIKPLFDMTESSRQKSKYLEKEKSFFDEKVVKAFH